MSTFSFKGRINRIQYITRILVLSVLISLFLVLGRYGFYVFHIHWMNALTSILVLICIIVLYASMTKRLHDFGKSGKWIIPSIIVNTLSLVSENSAFQFFALPYLILLFIKGDPSSNIYGAPPHQFAKNDKLVNTLPEPSIKNNESANIFSNLFSKNINIAKILGVLFLLGTVAYNNFYYNVYYLSLESFIGGRLHFHQEYPIYDLMRIIITVFAIWAAKEYYDKGVSLGVWTFLFIAILFNPIMVISFDISTLEIIDIITAVVFVASIYLERKYEQAK